MRPIDITMIPVTEILSSFSVQTNANVKEIHALKSQIVPFVNSPSFFDFLTETEFLVPFRLLEIRKHL